MPARMAPEPGGGEERSENSVLGKSALTLDEKLVWET